MKILKIFIVVVMLLTVAGVGFYTYMGGFHSVTIEKETLPATEIFYTTHVGPYQKLGESWEAFVAQMQANQIGPCDAMAVYLDTPETPPEKLRSILACKVSSLDEGAASKAKQVFPTFTLPSAEVYSGRFPYRNILSFWMAPTRVYPEMAKLIQDGQIQPSVAIEAYGFDESRSEIQIMMPTSRERIDYKQLIDAFGSEQR